MFSDYVAPYLAEFSGGTIFSRTVGVFGLSESALAERLADLMSEANPTVAPYAGNGEVVLRVTAHAADTEAARRLCDRWWKKSVPGWGLSFMAWMPAACRKRRWPCSRIRE